MDIFSHIWRKVTGDGGGSHTTNVTQLRHPPDVTLVLYLSSPEGVHMTAAVVETVIDSSRKGIDGALHFAIPPTNVSPGRFSGKVTY